MKSTKYTGLLRQNANFQKNAFETDSTASLGICKGGVKVGLRGG